MQYLIDSIRNVPDFPKEGIQFKDITTLCKDPKAFKKSIDLFVERYKDKDFDKILGIEARGFIFGTALAYALGKSFIVVRKPGKLPAKCRKMTYDLEYGTDTVEIHEDAVSPGEKILIVDDLLATGGTVGAVVKLVQEMGGVVAECAFLIELDDLKAREKLSGVDVFSLIHFDI